jgi:hypothetical protein
MRWASVAHVVGAVEAKGEFVFVQPLFPDVDLPVANAALAAVGEEHFKPLTR